MEFEYYFDPVRGAQEGEMKWVKMLSPQTIHMAMCLQFMVEEMLRTRKKKVCMRKASVELSMSVEFRKHSGGVYT